MIFRDFWQDIRFGKGALLSRPGITLAVVASLALGIGCNTAIFTLLDALFLRPLPAVEAAHRLVVAFETKRDPKTGTETQVTRFSYPNYRALRDRADGLSSLAAVQRFPVSLAGGSEPSRVTAVATSANYFSTLGLEPALGRFFAADEEEPFGAHAVAVLSHGLWRRLFGGDPDVVDSKVTINGNPFTIVGVAPEGFRGTDVSVHVDLFVSVSMYKQVSPWPELFDDRDVKVFELFGRMEPGVELAQAEAGLDAAAAELEKLFPVINEGMGARLVPLVDASINPGKPGVRERFAGYWRILSIAASLILLLACINVAGLLFVRGIDRGREVAIRQSLGATRSRLIRQLLTETSLLIAAAGLLSLPTARICLDLLWSVRPPEFAGEGLELALDPRIVLFALLVSLVVGLLTGVVPAIRASRPDLNQELKATGAPAVASGGRLGLRNLMVTAQVALATVALVCAGLFLKGLAQARAVDLGFASDELAVLTVAPGAQGYERARARELYERILETTRSLPGVTHAALSENRLLRGGVVQKQVYLPGADSPTDRGGRLWYRTNRVSPGYFEMAGIPILVGRDFGPVDGPDSDIAVIINRTMAEREFGSPAAALDRRIHFDYPTTEPLRIVGVAEDAKYRQIHEPAQYFFYLAASQDQPMAMTLHVRTAGSPASVLETLRGEVSRIDPALPIADLAPLSQFVNDALWIERMSAGLLTAFGVLALTLAAVGLYGVMRYSASQRYAEVAVRIALGADRGDALRRILVDGALVATVGLVAGLGLAVAVMRLTVSAAGLESELLHGVSVVDPMTYGPLALLLLGVALLGSYLPARRAATADPATALRSD